ncbi:hypothetical protein BpHYR1_010009 [Brachionus plicatilis]|uniref:Uncharacterized protein n=1 Tax=Brachionus plicatilis TaxID=10195 RepID=A0A3M7QNT4_BRAPC|nr:hypothetical protein BpHYR1_010009 [Brachionus plicatilis]
MSDKEKTLSDISKRKLDKQFKNRELPICPKCGNNQSMIPSVRGKPSEDLYLYSKLGHVKLSGCCETYEGWCKKCENFI